MSIHSDYHCPDCGEEYELDSEGSPIAHAHKSDRELLEEIHASQLRVEEAVTGAFAQLAPMLEAIKTKGIMGLMGMMK